MTRERAIAISLLKQASVLESAGRGVVRLARGTGKAGLGVLKGGGRLGKAMAEELGAPGAVGTVLGTAGTGLALAAGGKAVATEGKNRLDNWRLQHGLYPTPPVGYGY